jgi:hypothetical protein
MHMYGVINRHGTHLDVSKSERGAKIYATRHKYTVVSIRYNLGYVVKVIAEKNAAGKWVKAVNN